MSSYFEVWTPRKEKWAQDPRRSPEFGVSNYPGRKRTLGRKANRYGIIVEEDALLATGAVRPAYKDPFGPEACPLPCALDKGWDDPMVELTA